MISTRKSTTTWTNKNASSYGYGLVSSESKTLDKLPITTKSRYDGDFGTNPEELVGAAHSSCITMILTRLLNKAGYNELEIKTDCIIKFDVDRIIESKLIIDAKVPNLREEDFQVILDKAKRESLMTKILNIKIVVEYKFSSKAFRADGIQILGRNLNS